MAEFRLYCVSRGRTSRVLRAMLEKTLERGERSVVRVSSPRREEELDMFLWMEPSAGFLPHARVGRFRDGEEDFTAEQPVLLTTATGGEGASLENFNGASVLFHWQEGGELGMDIGVDGGRFGLCCFLYEEGDGEAGVVAEDLWERLCGMGGLETGFWYEEGGSWRRRGDENEDKVKVKDKVVAEKEKEQAEEQSVVGVSEPSQESLL